MTQLTLHLPKHKNGNGSHGRRERDIGSVSPPASDRTNIRKAVFERMVGNLIQKLDMVADRIPPDELGGANEAIKSINEVVEFLDDLRRG